MDTYGDDEGDFKKVKKVVGVFLKFIKLSGDRRPLPLEWPKVFRFL